MIQIAKDNPYTMFLAFTKRHNLEFSMVPGNLQIVASLWTGWGKRPGKMPVAWIQDGKEDRIPENVHKCPGSCESCKACWHLSRIGKDVVFDAH